MRPERDTIPAAYMRSSRIMYIHHCKLTRMDLKGLRVPLVGILYPPFVTHVLNVIYEKWHLLVGMLSPFTHTNDCDREQKCRHIVRQAACLSHHTNIPQIVPSYGSQYIFCHTYFARLQKVIYFKQVSACLKSNVLYNKKKTFCTVHY